MELALKNLEKALGNVGVLKHHWLRVRVNWETIRTTIRVSVAELDPDLNWLKDIHDTRLHYCLGTDTHPLLKVHSSKTKGTGENYRDFADEAPRALRQLALLDGRQFLRKFNAAVSIDSVVRLRSDAVTASAELKGFRETVREINDSPFVTQAIPKRAIVPSDGAFNDQLAPPEDGVKPVESGEASERTSRQLFRISDSQ
jgi:hypothetical protein